MIPFFYDPGLGQVAAGRTMICLSVFHCLTVTISSLNLNIDHDVPAFCKTPSCSSIIYDKFLGLVRTASAEFRLNLSALAEPEPASESSLTRRRSITH